MKDKYKLAASGCGILYLLTYFFLPFISVKFIGIGATGMDCISVSAWSYLPLIAGIAMIVCSFVLDPKAGMIVNLIGSFIPLITFFLFRADLLGNARSIVGSSVLSGLTSIGANTILTVGIGLILSILAGIGATVLCYLAGNAQKPADRAPGLGTNVDNEW